MDYTTEELQAFLNRAWLNASVDANSLPEQLLTEQQAALNFIASVGSLSHVSKNSTSQAYGGYNPGNLTMRQIVNLWTRLIEIYDDTKAAIVAAFATASIDIPDGFDFDPDVFAQMKNRLRVAGQADKMPDIRDLRVPLSRTATTEEVCA